MKSNITKLCIGVALCAVFFAPVMPCSADPSPPLAQSGPSLKEIQAFQLGLSLAMPGAEVANYLKDVEALKGSDDQDNAPAIAGLAASGIQLRRQELAGFVAGDHLIGDMGGPKEAQGWMEAAVATLAQPLAVSAEAKPDTATDPNTADVLSTIDEADSLKTNLSSHQQSLVTWIHLSAGRDAVWQEALGSFMAPVAAAAYAHRNLYIEPIAIKQLWSSLPPDAPQAVMDALAGIVGRSGDLAGVVSTAPIRVTPDQSAEMSAAILGAYRATALAESIEHGQ